VSWDPHQTAQAQHQLPSLSTVNTTLLPCGRECLRRAHSVALNFRAERSLPQTAGDLNISNYTILNTIQVACQKNLTDHSAPQRVEPAQHHESNAIKGSVQDWNPFPYLEQVGNILDSKSLPPPPPLPRMAIYPSVDALLSEYIAEPWECNAKGFLRMNLECNPYNQTATCKTYQFTLCGIKIRAWWRTMTTCWKKKTPLCVC
jgi:hypothetical protein